MTSVLNQGQALGEFEILEVAGIGGMGVVYRARQRSLDRIVALKVIRDEIAEAPEYRERFMREAHLAASVDHPHIVSVFDVGECDGRLFLAMQWVPGENLRSVLNSSGGLAPERAVRVLSQISGALDAIHGVAGLVHRDIKPSNVLLRNVGGSDHAYLTDFGVAKRSDTVADLTATGMVVGTVDYMAPEQITGGRTDARTDVYALGCVFYEMLSGRVPYERENSVAKLFAHVSDPPPRLQSPLAELYPAFGPVLEKAMAKTPRERYLSAGDFARDATAALQGMRYTGAPTIVGTGEAKPSPATPLPPTAVPTTPDPAQLETLRRALAGAEGELGAERVGAGSAERHVGGVTEQGQVGAVTEVQGAAAYPPTAPAAPRSEPVVQTHERTAMGPAAPQPPLSPQARELQPVMYQTYGHATPPPTQAPTARRGSPLALILLAAVAAAGVAAGVLAALGLFNSKPTSPPTNPPHRRVATWKLCGGDLSVGPDTSCAFARNVERAYGQSVGGNANVIAFSPVTRLTYTMHCTGGTPHVCRGGKGASVRFTSGPSPAPATADGYPVRPCDQNISANAVTSCSFAENTFRSYALAYRSGGRARDEVVGAFSSATGRIYRMSCTSNGARVSCSGGNHAFVTFPLHAAQVY
jgi:tRNA A-37 threonylcarbamoyl transferase component Bud32